MELFANGTVQAVRQPLIRYDVVIDRQDNWLYHSFPATLSI